MTRVFRVSTIGLLICGFIGTRPVSVVAQPEKVLDFTSDPEKIVAGVEQLGQRGGSAQILEAISESIDALAAPGKRPVIVVMRLSGGA